MKNRLISFAFSLFFLMTGSSFFAQNIDWSQVKPGQTIVSKEKKVVKNQNTTSSKKSSAKSDKKTSVIVHEYDGKQRVDPYTGWTYVAEKNIDIAEGCVGIGMKQSTGSFCLYNVRKGKTYPLLSSYDSFGSTFFTLRIDETDYKLSRTGGAECQPRRTAYGAQMAYSIEGKAYFVVDFSFMPSDADSAFVDALRVSLYLVNTSGKNESVTLKGLFDTCLGENTSSHFSTAKEKYINTEKQFRSFDLADAAWIRSANDLYSIQFLLSGKGITEPYCATLANKDYLTTSSWLPTVHDGKGFSSVVSYNNSALAINWNEIELAKNQAEIITFYITVGDYGKEPAGKDFLLALEEGRSVLHECTAPIVEKKEENPPVELNESTDTALAKTESRFWVGMPNIAGPESEAWKSGGGTSKAQEKKESEKKETKTNSTANTNSDKASSKISLKKEQLDTQYIQDLLDRIHEIENNGEVIDKAELKRLNDELDAILEKLRSNN